MIKANKHLDKIENYIPGKSTILGKKSIIKLSSNENALKASKAAIKAYKSHSDEIFRYASGDCQKLRKAIAAKNNINAQNIVCGAGSDEIINLLTLAFAGPGDEIIYSEHGFLIYPISAKKVGAKAVKAKEINLKSNVDNIIKAISKKTKIIFIANPNNPTGSYLNSSEINQLISLVPKNILIVLDSAYEEFIFEKDYPDAKKLVKKHPNIVMTRTFSKIYGLASLRIGWSYSSKYIADILNKIRGPFNVSGAAQEAAIVALQDQKFLEKSQKHNQKWLDIFFKQLANNDKIIAHPSVANFILLDFKDKKSCQKANEFLLENGVILRQMQAYNLPNCLRATIGTKKENLKLISLLKKL